MACAAALSGCSETIREGDGPVQAMVTSLEAAPGAEPNKFGGTLSSDVLTLVKKDVNGVKVKVPTIFSDAGRVIVTLALKNPGVPGSPTSPTAMNDVTFTRYRVVYKRADGRNMPGVDVPYPFDSAATFTARVGTPVTAGFELVRVTAKEEAPLRALVDERQHLHHDDRRRDVLRPGSCRERRECRRVDRHHVRQLRRPRVGP